MSDKIIAKSYKENSENNNLRFQSRSLYVGRA